MHLNNYVKTAIFGLVCLLSSISLVPTAEAFPTVDFGNIAKKVQSGIYLVQQKVKMVTQCKAVTEINNAIGKAKSMAAMAQSKAEELKKQAEKIKKIKEEAEKKLEKAKELKKKYEEQKAKLEEYQKKVKEQADKAKKAAEAAKAKVDEAKSKVNEVKSKVDEAKGAVDAVKSKVDEAKGAVNAVKEQAASKINTVQGAVASVQNATNAVSNKVSGAVSGAIGGVSSLQGPSVSAPSSRSVSTGSVSSVSSSGVAAIPQAQGFTQMKGDSVSLTSTGSFPNTSAATVSETKGRVGFTVGESAPMSFETTRSIGTPVTGSLSENVGIMEEETSPFSIKENVSLGTALAPAKVADSSTVKTQKKEQAKAEKSQVKAVKSTSAQASGAVKTAPSVNSASTPLSGAINVTSSASPFAPMNASAVKESVTPETVSEKVAPKSAEENIEAIEKVADEEGSFAALRTLKQTMTEAMRNGDTKTLGAIADMDTAKIVNSNSKIYEPTSGQTQGRKAFTLSPSKDSTTSETPSSVSDQKSTIKNPLTPTGAVSQTTPTSAKTLLQKNSNLWLDDGEFARQNSVKLSYADTLRFADGASDCDYDYKMIIEANNKTTDMIIMPESLAKKCCIKPENLKDMNVIKDCITKIATELTSDDEDTKKSAEGLFSDIIFESAVNGNTEAIEDKAVASSYKEDVLTPLYGTVKNVEDNNSGISNIGVANVQLLYLMNRIRKMYTTSLVSAGLASIDSATKEVLDPETDIGLDTNADQEFDYQVTRSDSEVAINLPIMPENLARKCAYTLESDVSVIKDCYIRVFNEQYEQDKEASSRAFIDNIQYNEMINVLEKGFFQKVKSAEYEQGEMKKISEATKDASDAHKGKEAMMQTEKGMLIILDDIIRGYASQIAYNGLTTLTKLMPVETPKAVQ